MKSTWTPLAAALLCTLGCTDFAEHRIGGVRKLPGDFDAPPAQASSVNQADSNRVDDGVQQAKFIAKPPEPKPGVDPKPNPALQNQSSLRALYERAKDRYAGMDSYIFRLKRREVVNGKRQPEELLLVKLRRQPYSVYLKWLNPECVGREVVYVQGKFDNKMQVKLAPQDPFALLMSRTSISPDDPLAKGKCRYPITETGFGPLIERFGKFVAAVEKGDMREGTAKFIKSAKRPEFVFEMDGVEQTLPPGCDPQLPKGGRRWWYFDPTSGLPALVMANDLSGEVEYYCYDHLQFPVHLDEEDFNPDWLRKK